MGSFKKYPEIALLHRVPGIMEESEVVAMEKVHGVNIRFGWVDGRFRLGSREMEFDLETSLPSSGDGVLGWVRTTDLVRRIQELARLQNAEIIFYGEWFGPGVKKGIAYAQEKQLRIFDVRIDGELVDWDLVVELTEKACLKTVPLLYRGRPSQDVFDEKRDTPSVVAFENAIESDNSEGIVIKPARMHRNLHGVWVIAKYKRPKFSERKSLSEGKAQPVTPATATAFVKEFFTLQRLEHVLDNLRSVGVDVFATSAIGQVIRGMYGDVLKESKPEYDSLDEDSRKAVDRYHAGKTKTLLGIWLASQTATAGK